MQAPGGLELSTIRQSITHNIWAKLTPLFKDVETCITGNTSNSTKYQLFLVERQTINKGFCKPRKPLDHAAQLNHVEPVSMYKAFIVNNSRINYLSTGARFSMLVKFRQSAQGFVTMVGQTFIIEGADHALGFVIP